MAMPQTIPWTRGDLDRLPDDGNRYEVLDGALLVSPAPSEVHQRLVARLNALLTPFVLAFDLGLVHQARSVIVVDGSQLEPDLMVCPIAPLLGWENAPLPLLVVEVGSGTTVRRDLVEKRAFYMKAGVPEYWVVDPRTRSIVRFTVAGTETVTERMTWNPASTNAELEIDVAALFALSLK